MLNFAEQTGSGAVMIVWSFLLQAVVEWDCERLFFSFFENKKQVSLKPKLKTKDYIFICNVHGELRFCVKVAKEQH